MKTIKLLLFAIAILALPRLASASIVGPYTVDSNTLHLWHFDQATTPVIDYGLNSTNLTSLAGNATLGNSSVLANFTNCFSSAAQSNAVLTPAGVGVTNQLTYAGANGAFTYEAIVHIEFDPSSNYVARGQPFNIINCDANSNPGRISQFRIDPIGFQAYGSGATGDQSSNVVRLEFINLHQTTSITNMIVSIPTTGPDAIVSNGWYHTAVTYSGTPNTTSNLLFYWTLMDSSRTNAGLIGGLNMPVSLSGTNFPTGFTVGNSGRNPSGNTANQLRANFLGKIDELRISSVARAADQMMFVQPAVSISQQPASVSITTNQTATFTVVASGIPPFGYQWYAYPTGGTTNALPNATNSTLSVTSGNSLGVTNYFVVVTNLVSSPATSSVATLTIRLPLNLTWAGVGSSWDTSTSDWTADNNASQTVYTDPDNVTFNNLGAGQSTVTLAQTLKPVSVTVSENASYTLNGSGSIAGSGSLTMNSSGTLIIDTVNTYTGATTISSGTLQLGDGTTTGTIGSGPVTNNSAFVVNPGSGGTVALTNTISGSGSLSVGGSANGTVTLSAANSYSGGTTLSAGVIQANASSALGSGLVTINSGSTVARINPANGVTLANNITLTSGAGGAARGILELADNQSATFGGTIEVDGTPATGGTIAGPVTTGLLSFTGPINGNGQIIIRLGNVRLSGGGNATYIRNDMNTLSIGANNGIPITASIIQSANGVATLDLNGFNQELAGLTLFGANNGIVTNSSASASTLTLNIPSANTYGGLLAGNLKLTKTGGGTLTLTNVNPLTGATLVSAGTLALTGSGSLASTTIAVDSGAVLDVTGRTSSTLNLGTGQVLSGIGTVSGSVNGGGVSPGMSAIGGLTVNGNVTLTGLTTFKVNKTASTSDALAVSGNVTYGGTLFATNLSGTLNIGDNYTIVTAAGQSGNFSSITGSPGAGKAWSFTNGVLSVVSGIATNPTNIVFSVSGSTLTLSWPADHLGWILQTQTNTLSYGLGTNWVDVPNSGSVTQQVITATPSNPSVFFRLRSP